MRRKAFVMVMRIRRRRYYIATEVGNGRRLCFLPRKNCRPADSAAPIYKEAKTSRPPFLSLTLSPMEGGERERREKKAYWQSSVSETEQPLVMGLAYIEGRTGRPFTKTLNYVKEREIRETL